jgi:AcrR family transcriptional regulator
MSATRISDLGAARRRADAQRSIDAIVEAARAVLGERPNASMEEIAAAAGVTRQTVYAHFPSRDALIMAVVHSVRDEGLAMLEAAGLDDMPPVDAMRAFLRISWQLIERFAVLFEPMLARISQLKSEQSHHGVDVVIERIVRRGLASGDFDSTLPVDWLAAAAHTLGHMAADQVFSGKLTNADAAALLETSILQLYGADTD